MTSLGVLLVAIAALTASQARAEIAPSVDVSFFDNARKLQLTGHLYRPDGRVRLRRS